jgi:uncharacterized protein (TIGR03435 family)
MIRGTLAAFLVALPAFGQTFEVASVKPAAPGGRGMSINRSEGGRFTTENIPLRFLITFAYNIRDHQLTGGPGWLSSDRWDIVARPESKVPDGPEGTEKIRAMVRALLAERFQLATHTETKELPIYALVVAKNGPKLTPSPPEARGPGLRVNRGLLTATKTPLSLLAQHLSNTLGRTVLDQTGITGNFDFKLEYATETMGPPGAKEVQEHKEASVESELPSVFTALQEQLGLRLEPKRAPVEIVVIDKVEKAAEN